MIKFRTVSLAAVLVTMLAAAFASSASASPIWRLSAVGSSNVAPGGQISYLVHVKNFGDAETDGSDYVLQMRLPEGLTALSRTHLYTQPTFDCTGNGPSPDPHDLTGSSVVTCTGNDSFRLEGGGGEGQSIQRFEVAAAPDASGLVTPTFKIWGGGARIANVDDGVCQDPARDEPCYVDTAPTRISADRPEFEAENFDVQITDQRGRPFNQAGAHPYKITTWIDFPVHQSPKWTSAGPPFDGLGIGIPVEGAKDVAVETPLGLVGDPTKFPRCNLEELIGASGANTPGEGPFCPQGSQVGTVTLRMNPGTEFSMIGPMALFNMVPSPGSPARFGFTVQKLGILLDAHIRSDGDYGLTIASPNIPQGLPTAGSEVVFWGVPGDRSHNFERSCSGLLAAGELGKSCPIPSSGEDKYVPRPFLRNPTNCSSEATGLPWTVHMASWDHPGRLSFPTSVDVFGIPDLSDSNWKTTKIVSHEAPGYPYDPDDPQAPAWGDPIGIEGCDAVPVRGEIATQPTTQSTETPSGLKVRVEVPNPGLDNPTGIASSDIKKIKVALPKGLTINPSQAEGLSVCTEAQFESEELRFFPGAGTGCPSASRIGSITTKSPLLDELLEGSVYVAEPYDNKFGSLLALYVVIKNAERGVLIKLAGKVEPDGETGQIVTTFDDLPQLPFSWFDLKFREGARAPLVTPAACGRYETVAEFIGHSDPDGPPVISKSSFQIDSGIGSGPCPTGGIPPFKPGLIAGTVNPSAGAYSSFPFRLFRRDGEQYFTNFSTKLPPGIVAKLAGVPFCSDSAIAAAKDPNRTGTEELSSPACPKASEIGRTLVGAGVGSVQTYVPGKIYLAGPYNGSALSIVAVTAAKVGPFDLGTVVIRQALRVNPETAEVFIDPTGSDPLPHIIDGIPTQLRDIRAYVDRPEFVINPTSCEPTSVASTVLGSGLDFANTADDEPVTVTTRFQAANCASLDFKPKLDLRLIGGTKRNDHPKFKAVLTARKGDANIGYARLTLPHSQFLDQSHIKTVCTRVQFAQGSYPGEKCPRGAVYGYAKAVTPLLDEPLQGPVFLRSSSNPLPDLVAALHSGKININLVGRIDSLKGSGQIRNTFATVPDAPVKTFTLTMLGGKKGLLVNSANLCKGTHRATAEFTGQNGKIHDFRPKLKAQCKGKGKKKR